MRKSPDIDQYEKRPKEFAGDRKYFDETWTRTVRETSPKRGTGSLNKYSWNRDCYTKESKNADCDLRSSRKRYIVSPSAVHIFRENSDEARKYW